MLKITKDLSQNFTPGGIKPLGVCLHGTLGGYNGAVEWIKTPAEKRNPVSYSSAHFVVAKDGRCTQLVEISDQSWHAGKLDNPTEYAKSVLPKNIFGTFKNPNESFIGIELEYFIGDVMPEAQLQACVDLIQSIGIKNPIILSHKEITSFKGDFQTLNGKIDMRIPDAVRQALSQASSPGKEEALKQIDELRNTIIKL